MSLQQPLLDPKLKYNVRRQSVLWSNFRILKPQKGQYEKRVGLKHFGDDNKNMYVYEGEKPIENSVFTELEASNLSFADDVNSNRLGRSSDLHIKKEQQLMGNSLEEIKEESGFLSEERLIEKSSAFISQSGLLNKTKARELQRQHIKKLQSVKKIKQLTFRQRLDSFFGEGINSLILTLSPNIIKFLAINIFFDIIARGALLYISLAFFFAERHSPNDFVFIIPLAAMLLSRVLFIMTLIKMNYAEKPSICVAYQKSFDSRSYFQIESDRLFRRHYNAANIIGSVRRSFIPPELSYFFINQSPQKLKIYFLMCMIFKGIETMIVLPMFVVTLMIGSRLSSFWDIVCVSYMLEEAVRYVLNFLIINTLSK